MAHVLVSLIWFCAAFSSQGLLTTPGHKSLHHWYGSGDSDTLFGLNTYISLSFNWVLGHVSGKENNGWLMLLHEWGLTTYNEYDLH